MTNNEDDIKYVTIKVTKRAFKELLSIRDELFQKGFSSLPTNILPENNLPSKGRISISFVCEVGVKSIRKLMK